MDQHIHSIASTVRGKLLQQSPWPANSCIFRVPRTLRRHNQTAYEPQLVSIGPLHHGRENLQAMEEIKLWYLRCLLARAPTPQTSLECFIEAIRSNVKRCRQCYAEEVNHSTDELVEMMVVDGCFIIELFRKSAKIVPPNADDPIFKSCWMLKNLWIDLLLLENQLPWFVLKCLLDLTKPDPDSNTPSLSELAITFFDFTTLRTGEIKPDPTIQNKHLLDFQRNILLSSVWKEPYRDTEPYRDVEPVLDWHMIPCVTQLLQAGVQFEKGDRTEILNIQFDNGVMKIPPIMIVDNAESFIRNLIAYEQCDRRCKDKITSYALFWENLINSSKDLDFLRQKGIITCFLDTEELSRFFKRLYIDAHVMYYSYAKLSSNINAYYQRRLPRWRVTLLRNYFGNPWSIIKFIAAFAILILTFLQTLFSILYH